MKKCGGCGKKGLFLSLSARGLCKNCEKEDELKRLAEKEEKERVERERKQAEIMEQAKKQKEQEEIENLKNKALSTKLSEPLQFVAGCYLKYQYTDVGIAFPNEIELLRSFGKTVHLELDASNQYDNETVNIYNSVYENGKVTGKILLGYLYKGKLRDMVRDWLNRDELVMARISSIENSLDLYFYVDIDTMNFVSKTFMLTATGSVKKQEALMYLEDGDFVNTDGEEVYDDSGEVIGKLSSAAQTWIDEHAEGNNFKLMITDYDDSDEKIKTKVKIFCIPNQ